MDPIAPRLPAILPSAPATAPHAASSAPAAPAPAPNVPPQQSQDMRAVAQQIQTFLQSSRPELEFSVDQSSGKVVLRISDPETGKVVRQIPSEEMLALSKALDQLKGLLFSGQA
jgi:flagellar protein FlaG